MNIGPFTDYLAAARESAHSLGALAATQSGRPVAALLPQLLSLCETIDALQSTGQDLCRATDDLRARQAKIDAERQRYRSLFEFAPDGYLITDARGIIQEANWAAGILLNEPEDALVQRDLAAFIVPGETAAFDAEMRRLDSVDGVREWETRLQPRDYAPFDASVAVLPDRDHTGHVTGLRWMVRDITARRRAAEQMQSLMASLEQRVQERTVELKAANLDLEKQVAERKRTEASLHATNGILMALVQSSPLAIIVRDCNGCVQTWSPAAERLYGWPAEAVIGCLPPYILSQHAADAAAPPEPLSESCSDAAEERHVRRDGSFIDVSAWSGPLRDAHGQVIGSMHVYTDVSERKRAQAQITYQAHLLNNVHDAVIATDADQRLTAWNRAAETMYGWRADEVLGRSAAEIVRPLPANDDDSARPNGVKASGRGSQEVVHHRRDGTPVHIGETVMTLRSADGAVTGYVSVIRDITERKLAEAALRDSQARLSAVINSAMDGIITADEDLNIVLFNAAAETMFGSPAAAVIGQPLIQFIPAGLAMALRPHQRAFEASGAASRTTGPHSALTGRRANGEEFPFEASVSNTVANGHSFFTIILRDITDRVRDEAEIRTLNASLERRVAERTAQLEAKNRELETFTYSVSHDLKAPLRGIDGFTRLLLDEHGQGLNLDGRNILGSIRRAVQHMNQLIDALLSYSRLEQQRVTAGPVDLLAVVDMVVDERMPELTQRGIHITIDVACAVVVADADGLAQAIRNLLDNAIKFTHLVPAPSIEIRGVEHGGLCRLSVRDNGIGFDMRFHDRIFGIFQRLHRAEDVPGTGIGLAIVQKAMRRMNGRVWAESTVGQGACFYLEIPR
jgi:PAS domain S-box-containing protein